MPTVCPCGSRIKAGQSDMAYITQAVLDAAQATNPTRIITLLDPIYGRAVDLRKLCAFPAPQPPTSLGDWYEDPVSFLDDILRAVLAINWNLWCECKPCPPIAGCTGGNSFFIDPAGGYCPPAAQVVPPDPCAPCQSFEYVLHDTATYYVKNSLGTCYGPFTGLDVRWTCPSFDPPDGRVIVESYGGTGIAWSRAVASDEVQVFMGSGQGAGPNWLWVTDGTTVAIEPVPPVCDPTTICTAVEYIRDRVSVLERLMVYTMQQLDIANQAVTIRLPGGGPPITGPIAEVIGHALQAILPILPIQLTSPVVTTIAVSSTIDVTNLAYVNIVPTVVPDWMGHRGVGPTEVYYSNARNPGPGEAMVFGQNGILSVHPIVYPTGAEFAIPSTATDIAVRVEPGVQVTITTWTRSV